MQTNPGLLDDLNALVEPDARGDPMSPLRWTCTLRRLAAELEKLGHKVSHTVVGELLKKQKFSLQANRKTREGADNPDRDRQFRVVNDAVKAAMAETSWPYPSIRRRRNWSAISRTPAANGADKAIRKRCARNYFLIKDLGRAVPYGIYDLTPTPAGSTSGWTTTRPASRFRRSADGGKRSGAFATRWRAVWSLLPTAADRTAPACVLWKLELQRLADELGLSIEVHHLPPGTSKWNKIEHRLFSFITQNWRAKPLLSYRVIVELIGATTTQAGLTVRCELDTKAYPKGIVVSDEQMKGINIQPEPFHGEWNYSISPSIPSINQSG